jgi:hypothetical protein
MLPWPYRIRFGTARFFDSVRHRGALDGQRRGPFGGRDGRDSSLADLWRCRPHAEAVLCRWPWRTSSSTSCRSCSASPPPAVLARHLLLWPRVLDIDLASCAPLPTPAARARLPPTASYLQRTGCIKLASPLTGGMQRRTEVPRGRDHWDAWGDAAMERLSRPAGRQRDSERRRHPSRRAEGTSGISPGRRRAGTGRCHGAGFCIDCGTYIGRRQQPIRARSWSIMASWVRPAQASPKSRYILQCYRIKIRTLGVERVESLLASVWRTE